MILGYVLLGVGYAALIVLYLALFYAFGRE